MFKRIPNEAGVVERKSKDNGGETKQGVSIGFARNEETRWPSRSWKPFHRDRSNPCNFRIISGEREFYTRPRASWASSVSSRGSD